MKTSLTLQQSDNLACRVVLLFFVVFAFGCLPDQSKKQSPVKDKSNDNYVDITTLAMEFNVQDTIKSGWNTFRYINKSGETHFFILEKYPEGKTIEDGKKEIIPVFQAGMDLINQDKAEEGFAEFGNLPPWFGEITFTSGSGLLSPANISETTLYLEPGYYVIECYVKMMNGIFHSAMGMVEDIVVVNESSQNTEPNADVHITISSTEGIQHDSKFKTGSNIISVEFIDQGPHEHFIGHDINLVKIDGTADLEALEQWMDWSKPNGLITPPPVGCTFLGGVNEGTTGSKGYFNVDLKTGNYVLISEVPNSLEKNMLVQFNVD